MTARNVAISCQDGQYSAYGSNFNVGTTSVWIVITSRLVATPALIFLSRRRSEQDDLHEQHPDPERLRREELAWIRAHARRRPVEPHQRVEALQSNVEHYEPPRDPPEQLEHLRLHEPFSAQFGNQPGREEDERGAGGDRRNDEQEKRGRPDRDPLSERERPSPEDAVQPPERALVEEREKGAYRREHRHHLVELELEHEERGDLAELAVLEQDREVLDRQHRQVAGDAERDLGEHRVHVGVPEREPGPQRLTDIHHQA